MRQCPAATCNGYNQHVEMPLYFAIFQSETSLLHNNSTTQQSNHYIKMCSLIIIYFLYLTYTVMQQTYPFIFTITLSSCIIFL